ncbi:MAG: helix-turn-helix domain-containing protein [Roseburia sp.]
MKRLKELREAKHLSQQALADIFHVTQQSIYKYEHEIAEPDLDVIIRMADFFNVSVDYLIGYSDIPLRYEAFSNDSLTRDELNLLTYYRSLSPHTQELIQELIHEKKQL